MAAHQMAAASNELAQIIISAGSTLTSALLIFIAATLRKGVRKLMSEHRWLMTTVARDTEAIKRMLAHIEASETK
jgi:hypothetical protein